MSAPTNSMSDFNFSVSLLLIPCLFSFTFPKKIQWYLRYVVLPRFLDPFGGVGERGPEIEFWVIFSHLGVFGQKRSKILREKEERGTGQILRYLTKGEVRSNLTGSYKRREGRVRLSFPGDSRIFKRLDYLGWLISKNDHFDSLTLKVMRRGKLRGPTVPLTSEHKNAVNVARAIKDL